MTYARSDRQTWSGGDRRQGERRTGERRRAAVRVATERRAGGERRCLERRSGDERRGQFILQYRPERRTPLPFAPPDMARIRSAVAAGATHVICPVCSGALSGGPAIVSAGRTVREYRCADCRRGVMVEDPA